MQQTSTRSSDPVERPLWTRLDSFVIVFVAAAASAIRAVHLTQPNFIVADEMFYAREACFRLYRSEVICGIGPAAISPQPPLGKMLIGLGIRAFGMNSFGWRISAVLTGIITVALLYALARRLLRSTLGATITAGLLAIDFLHVVQSRLAMLDVFLTFFVVAGFLFLVVDGQRAEPPRSGSFDILSRRWLLAAGIAAGAAVATKWVGLLALAGVAVLALRNAVGRQAYGPWHERIRHAVRTDGAALLIALVIAPPLVYTASYIGTVEASVFTWPWEHGSWPRRFVYTQLTMLRDHVNNRDVNANMSPAWSWPLVRRPVIYLAQEATPGRYREIKAMGSPLVWWTSLAALGYLIFTIVRRRRPNDAAIVVVTGFALLYFPLLAVNIKRSFTFLYYLLPAVPFMCLAVGAVATEWARSLAGRVIVAAFALAALLLFAFFYPVLTAAPVSRSEKEAREWFRDCQPPPTSPAPTGWCWQ